MSNEINVGAISEALNNKVDLNQLNTNTQGLEYVSGLSTPSNRYVNLTAGADSTQYIAPANGWFVASGFTSGQGMIGFEGKLMQYCWVNSSNGVSTNVSVKKGDVVRLRVINITSVNTFKFVYAEGAE